MKRKYYILHLDINGTPKERVQIPEGEIVDRIKEGFLTAYQLTKAHAYEIYYYAPSKMNNDESINNQDNGRD